MKINHTYFKIACLCAIVGVAILLYFFDPKTSGFFPPCPSHFLTGFYCPGCGTLRCIHSLVHGEFLLALRYNILTILAFPLLILMTIFPDKFSSSRFAIGLLIVIISFTVLRNIPHYPFDLLAPASGAVCSH